MRRRLKPGDSGERYGNSTWDRNPRDRSCRFSDEPTVAKSRVNDRLRSGPEDWGQLRTPSLRNVAVTALCMHQGQLQTVCDMFTFDDTLERAVTSGHHLEQIHQPLILSEQEMSDLLAFLESLTDVSPDPSLLWSPHFRSIGQSDADRYFKTINAGMASHSALT